MGRTCDYLVNGYYYMLFTLVALRLVLRLDVVSGLLYGYAHVIMLLLRSHRHYPCLCVSE